MIQVLDERSKLKPSEEYKAELKQMEADASEIPKFKALA
jgi:hypothetical protein